jgi:hypothetical protein
LIWRTCEGTENCRWQEYKTCRRRRIETQNKYGVAW